jgi:hypothetical protein
LKKPPASTQLAKAAFVHVDILKRAAPMFVIQKKIAKLSNFNTPFQNPSQPGNAWGVYYGMEASGLLCGSLFIAGICRSNKWIGHPSGYG